MNTHICVCTHNWRCACVCGWWMCRAYSFSITFTRVQTICECARNFTLCIYTSCSGTRATFFLTHFSRLLLLLLSSLSSLSFFSLSFFDENRIITIVSIVYSIDNTVTLNRWCCNEIGSSCSTSCRPYRTKIEHFRRIQSIRRWKSFDNSTNRPTAKSSASAVPGLQSK